MWKMYVYLLESSTPLKCILKQKWKQITQQPIKKRENNNNNNNLCEV